MSKVFWFLSHFRNPSYRSPHSLHWRLCIAIVLVALAVGSFSGTNHPVFADGTGQACIFFAPSGAASGPFHLGHVGWGFRDGPSNHWFFGATENETGQLSLNGSQNNYAWIHDGNETLMYKEFRERLVIQHRVFTEIYHPAGYYKQMRCKNTTTSAVNSAWQVATALLSQGYLVGNNDCETAAQQVLTAYDSHIFDSQKYGTVLLRNGSTYKVPLSDDSPIPAAWFGSLDIDGFGPISSIPAVS